MEGIESTASHADTSVENMFEDRGKKIARCATG
jgi:hypothetical protein